MIKFLLKGLVRDKSRSLLPIIVVTLGVMITVILQAYMSGVLGDSIESTARFTTGHVKVMTKAYQQNMSQIPNDYALIGIEDLKRELEKENPDFVWTERIQFGGLLDAPDAQGDTRAQGNVMGMGVKLFESRDEIERMELSSKLYSGRFPRVKNEVLLSNDLFEKMGLRLGDKVTLMSTGMYGDMVMANFRVVGTLYFGIKVLDKGFMLVDVGDVANVLNMEDAAGEILGFIKNKTYDNDIAVATAEKFNQTHHVENDQFSPVMLALRDMNGMEFFVAYADMMQTIIILVFAFAMSIVLWNAGLLGGLRRYGEFGLRLAIGENKHEIYISLVGEAILVGLIGSIIGVSIGLVVSWLMQTYGLNTSEMMKDTTFMMPTILRSKITFTTYYIGFIPGLLSTVLGAMLAGIGIYKRQTANLFKELEN